MITFNKFTCKVTIILLLSAIVAVLLAYVLYSAFQCPDCDTLKPANKQQNITLSTGPETLTGFYARAAVVSNAPPCASIAKDVLLEGGKAVDAIIAAMLCDGVTMPQSMGIGGGFFMTIYEKSKNKVSTINAREAAPDAASLNMFHSNSNLAKEGPLSIAVPGEVKGYWAAYQQFGGGVSWKRLFEPTISLCENGIPIGKKLAAVLQRKEDQIKTNPELRLLFLNLNDSDLLEAGQTYKNLKLAKTLRTIAEEGSDSFYKGSIAKALVKDIQAAGGIISETDLANYEAYVEKPLAARIFDNLTLYTTNPPSSGAILSYILQIVNGILPAPSELLNTQRITEAMKYGFGARTRLGDPRFVNINKTMSAITSDTFIDNIRSQISDNRTWNNPTHYGADYAEMVDKGTANLAVIAENGDAVVATSTINYLFGSLVVSNSTGIILNDEMDDFSSPHVINTFGIAPSKANFIEPRKRPLSSMNPAVVVDDNGDAKLLIGAAGGTRITTSVSLAIIHNLVMKETIRESINNALFHHQLIPMVWEYYSQMPKEIVEGMKKIGHEVKLAAETDFAAITAIQSGNDSFLACTDYKRPGQVDGY